MAMSPCVNGVASSPAPSAKPRKAKNPRDMRTVLLYHAAVMKNLRLLCLLSLSALGCELRIDEAPANTSGVNYANSAQDPSFERAPTQPVEETTDEQARADALGDERDMSGTDAGSEEESSSQGTSPDLDPEGAPIDLNLGWIGGPCTDDLGCGYEEGLCLQEDEGFPDGHCSKPCELYCPDQDGAATTFCVNPSDLELSASEGLCAMQCDFGMSPTGCRAGYYCGALERFSEPETVKFACIPGDAPEVAMSDCMLELVERGVGFQIGHNPMDSPDGHPDLICDIKDPIWVDGTMAGVNYRYGSAEGAIKRIFTNCELAIAMHDTATLVAAQGVTDIIHVGVYNCRVISGTSKLSEHAFANAIDISGFRLESGSVWTLYDHWEHGTSDPLTAAGDWLLWFANELYVQWIFNIILTPEYNAAHDDHFHCDLTPGAHSLH